jgi:hypothetical protein
MRRSCPAQDGALGFIIARRRKNWVIFGFRTKGKKKNTGEVMGSEIKTRENQARWLKSPVHPG